MKTDVDHVALECLKEQSGVLAVTDLECVVQEHWLDWKCILFYSRKALIQRYFDCQSDWWINALIEECSRPPE